MSEMNKTNDLKIIKKKYGEKFAQMCRNLFPTILEQKDVLPDLLAKTFAPNKNLYEDLIDNDMKDEFKNFILSKFHFLIEKKERISEIAEDPFVLIKKAGYTLTKCENDKDVQKFKKYWKSGEELCTFRDKKRTETNIVFFAVKEGAENLKRKDFKQPKRQDEYGTSVVSIQFSKSKNSILSIKNRYNHTVENPDATFSNDLENIYAGLTESFTNKYNINLVSADCEFELPNYTMANDGVFYPYIMEEDNVYYCHDNIVISNGEVRQYDKSRYELVEHFLIDKQAKTIINLLLKEKDSFTDAFKEITKINIENDKDNKRNIFIETTEGNAKISIDKQNRIVGYANDYVKEVGDHFLYYNKSLERLDLPQLTKVGDDFLHCNKNLERLDLPNLKMAGNDFLYLNKSLESLSLPNLEMAGDGFLQDNKTIENLDLPNLKIAGNSFLHDNSILKNLSLPNLAAVGYEFLCLNKSLENLSCPQLETAGYAFLFSNDRLESLSLPNLETIESYSLFDNKRLESLSLPNLKTIWGKCLYLNKKLETLNLPKLVSAGKGCLGNNPRAKKDLLLQIEQNMKAKENAEKPEEEIERGE